MYPRVDWPWPHTEDDHFPVPDAAWAKLSPEDRLDSQSVFGQQLPNLINRQQVIEKYWALQRLFALCTAVGLTITDRARTELAVLGRIWLPRTEDELDPSTQRTLRKLYSHMSHFEISTYEALDTHLSSTEAELSDRQLNTPGLPTDSETLQQLRYWAINR